MYLFKNNCFKEHLWTSASKHYLIRETNTGAFLWVLLISEFCSLKSIYLVEQWYIRRRNSQTRSILCSYGNQVETSLSSCGNTCTHLGIPRAGEVEEKEELKSLFMWGEFSFHAMIDREILHTWKMRNS